MEREFVREWMKNMQCLLGAASPDKWRVYAQVTTVYEVNEEPVTTWGIYISRTEALPPDKRRHSEYAVSEDVMMQDCSALATEIIAATKNGTLEQILMLTGATMYRERRCAG